ncbi:MAG: N-acetyltransferase [Negativicutes bacterium]|jgi:putative acetyltransferase
MKINAVVVSVPREYVYRVLNIHKSSFSGTGEAKLVAELAKTDNYIDELSLAGVVDGRYIAHVLLSKIIIKSETEEIPALALAPVATLPRFRKLGVASHLIKYAINKAGKTRSKFIIVVGDPKFYSRFGFVAASEYNLRAPFAIDDECFLALKIEDQRNFSGGEVLYSEPFANI